MNDPTDLPFDRIPLSGPTATLPGPKVSLDDLLAGSALLPPTRTPVAISPPAAGPKVTAEPAKPAADPAPPPEPRWVKEAVVTLLTPTRKKVVVLSSAAALAAGALAVNVLFSGKGRTPPTAPAPEGTEVVAAAPVSSEPKQPATPEPAGAMPAVGIPVVPPMAVPIPSPLPAGYQPGSSAGTITAPPVVPTVPPGIGSSTITTTPTAPSGLVIPDLPLSGIITAGASDPIPAPAIPGVPILPPSGGTPGPMATAIPAGGAPNQTAPGTGLPPPVKAPNNTPAAGQGTSPGTGLPPPAALPTGGTGMPAPTPFVPPTDPPASGAAANFKPVPADVPGAFTLTKRPDPPVRSTEPTRTDFDLDLHEPSAGETYATISKLHYGDAKYADALRAFNRNAELGRTTVEVPPMFVLRKRYPQFIGRPAGGEAGRDRGVDWGPSSQ